MDTPHSPLLCATRSLFTNGLLIVYLPATTITTFTSLHPSSAHLASHAPPLLPPSYRIHAPPLALAGS